MPTRLIILRHGETEWNTQNLLQGQGNSPLTKNGIKQVKKAGESLAEEKIDLIYVSSLGRTIQTYETIKPFIKTKPVVHISDLIVERAFGEGEGIKISAILEKYPEIILFRKSHPYQWRIPGGESYLDIQKRVIPFVDEIVSEHKNKNILLVTHGAVSKVLLLYYRKTPLKPWPAFTIPNAGINILSFDKKKVTTEKLEITE